MQRKIFTLFKVSVFTLVLLLAFTVMARADDVNEVITESKTIEEGIHIDMTIYGSNDVNNPVIVTVPKAGIEVIGTDSNPGINIKSGYVKITGGEIKRHSYNANYRLGGYLIDIAESATLTLENVTISGVNENDPVDSTYNGENPLIRNNGVLNINNGTVIKDIYLYKSLMSGGAVNNMGSGTVNMSGGEIKNCRSGRGSSLGIAIINASATATVNISGGKVSDCKGVIVNNLGTLTISGGEISDNTGIVLSDSGTTTISGGKIDANGNPAISVNKGNVSVDGGIIKGTLSGTLASGKAGKVDAKIIEKTSGNISTTDDLSLSFAQGDTLIANPDSLSKVDETYTYVWYAAGQKEGITGDTWSLISAPTGITLDQNTAELEYPEGTSTLELIATVTPDDAEDTSVIWSSSDKNIAEVDSEGNVTAKGVGTVTITASTVNGLTAECTITVKGTEYSITYDANGGTINGEKADKYNYGTAVTLPTDVTLDGMAFLGWYDKETGALVKEISATDKGAKTYNAKWALGAVVSYVKKTGSENSSPFDKSHIADNKTVIPNDDTGENNTISTGFYTTVKVSSNTGNNVMLAWDITIPKGSTIYIRQNSAADGIVLGNVVLADDEGDIYEATLTKDVIVKAKYQTTEPLGERNLGIIIDGIYAVDAYADVRSLGNNEFLYLSNDYTNITSSVIDAAATASLN